MGNSCSNCNRSVEQPPLVMDNLSPPLSQAPTDKPQPTPIAEYPRLREIEATNVDETTRSKHWKVVQIDLRKHSEPSPELESQDFDSVTSDTLSDNAKVRRYGLRRYGSARNSKPCPGTNLYGIHIHMAGLE